MGFLNLQHTRSDGEVDTYYLKSLRPYTIGRGSQCEIRILDVRMSRQHGIIEPSGDAWRYIHKSSTNGFTLNGEKTTSPCPLRVGDVLGLGRSELLIDDITEHCSAPPPTVRAEFRRHTEDGPDAGTAGIRRSGDVLAQTDSYIAGEKRSIYITVLGKKVGPLTRKEARELKKREIKGDLREADIADRISEG